MNSFFEKKIFELIPVFEKHKLKRVYVFGSVCTDHFNDKSDIDFLISFKDGLNPVERGEIWWELFYAIKKLLNRDVDLLTEETLQNPYFIKEVNASKVLIYGK